MNENEFRGALSDTVTELQVPPPMQLGPALAAGRRAQRRRRTVVTCAAFVAVALVASAGTLGLNNDRRDGRPASNPGGSGGSAHSTSASSPKPADATSRLLIDEPGWNVTDVYQFTGEQGTISFSNAELMLEMEWTPASQYDSYRDSRLHKGSEPEKVQVAGSSGELFKPSDESEVILQPRDGSFVTLRAKGDNWTRAVLDRVLGHVIRVDVRTWEAAMPAGVVTPDTAPEQAAKLLVGVPLPPGFDTGALRSLGTNDAYQFRAAVITQVGCGWIAEARRARQAGDNAAYQRAGEAMHSSHDWTMLKQGDGGEGFWETADKVAAGDQEIISGKKNPLGCK